MIDYSRIQLAVSGGMKVINLIINYAISSQTTTWLIPHQQEKTTQSISWKIHATYVWLSDTSLIQDPGIILAVANRRPMMKKVCKVVYTEIPSFFTTTDAKLVITETL